MLLESKEFGAGDFSSTMNKTPQRREAALRLAANAPLPSVATNSGQIGNANHLPFAAGREAVAEAMTNFTLPLAPLITELRELQKQRVFCIKSQSRLDRACEAFISRQLGYAADLPEKERKAIFARAAAMRKAVEGGRPGPEDRKEIASEVDGEGQPRHGNLQCYALSVCAPIILASKESRATWDAIRKGTEKRMRGMARQLPVWVWAENVAGFGELSVAIIAGEAGDVGSYTTKERLWKRLGLAVIEGERQQRRANAEQAAAHGYSPRRRAEIWAIADSMFKHQWRGEKDGVAAHPVGPYGEVYAARKANTEGREWSLKHRDADARRVMTKALIEDYWRVWRGLPPLAPYAGPREGFLPETHNCPLKTPH